MCSYPSCTCRKWCASSGFTKSVPQRATVDSVAPLRLGDAIDSALALVRAELIRAAAKHAPMHSLHEAWGVIDEEFREFKDAVHDNNTLNAKTEAIQIAAMAARVIVDL